MRSDAERAMIRSQVCTGFKSQLQTTPKNLRLVCDSSRYKDELDLQIQEKANLLSSTKSMSNRENKAFFKFVENLDKVVTASQKLREADDNHTLKNVWRD